MKIINYSLLNYIKEKWYMFLLIFLSLSFFVSILWLTDISISKNDNILYAFSGVLLFLFIFIIIDYFIVRSRIIELKKFVNNGGTGMNEFFYPADIVYANAVSELAGKYNKLRTQIAIDSADELDFITKWVHDVKVPIFAMKLMIEDDTDYIKEKLEMELLSIEQNTQKILFHIKSNSFYDDYKISEVHTRNIINTALKQYATFFSYKKISLNLDEDDFSVLTDSKWSGYIISQFLSNAVKHTPSHGKIAITTIELNSKIIISVKNTGQGIRSNDMKQIFNRGYTSRENRSGHASTGYGLYLSKKLADKLGHEIYATSKHGEFAEFSLVFKNNKNDIYVTRM